MSEFGPKKQPGDRNLSARAWNALTDAQTFRREQPNSLQTNNRDFDQVKAENGSGYDADPFTVLRAESATWPERTDETFDREGMRNGVELLTDSIVTEWDSAAILQKSAPSGKFAPGVISGPTPCRVLFPDAASLDYPFAIPIPSDPAKLQASPFGLNRILWHAEPDEEQEGCDPRILQAYVNMGEDGQWVWFRLEEDLPCCGSASAKLVDQCGTPIGDCPIVKTIWGPKCFDLCACSNEESPSGWKSGDVVPCWWYQYLEKWVTIPNFTAGFEKQSIQVVTGGSITGASIEVSDQQFVTGVAWAGGSISVVDSEEILIPTSGEVTLSGESQTVVSSVSFTPSALSATTAEVPISTSGSVDVTLETTPKTVVTSVTHTPCELSVNSESVTIPTGLNLSGSVNLETENKTVLTSVTLNPENLQLHPTLETVLKSVTLDASKLTLTVTPKTVLTGATASLSGLSGSVTYQKATGLDFSNVTFSVTLPVISKTVVTSVSVDGCDVIGTTETLQAIDPSGSATVSMSGTPALTYTDQTANITFSGGTVSLTPTTETLNLPTGIQAASGVLSSATADVLKTATVEEVPNTSALNVAQTVLPLPTSATLNLSGQLTGAAHTLLTSATLTPGDVSTTTETLNLPTSASGTIAFTPGESQTVVTSVTFTPSALSTASTQLTVPTSAELTLTGYTPYEIPTAFQFEIEPLAVTKAPVTAEVSGGSISFTTSTINVLACRACQ